MGEREVIQVNLYVLCCSCFGKKKKIFVKKKAAIEVFFSAQKKMFAFDLLGIFQPFKLGEFRQIPCFRLTQYPAQNPHNIFTYKSQRAISSSLDSIVACSNCRQPTNATFDPLFINNFPIVARSHSMYSSRDPSYT